MVNGDHCSASRSSVWHSRGREAGDDRTRRGDDGGMAGTMTRKAHGGWRTVGQRALLGVQIWRVAERKREVKRESDRERGKERESEPKPYFL
ncbi:hypothetical protein GUJ93_ZPchr0002g25365 [Zizania palustris]|uniref:Uncharacterized protein n=1 Tax=Zizania palustris TaxID=103762 RepID=A0A8J5RIQ8_ZIZPA|nr:hypothetical protein GUJ93_ZPchr0002g25365 [Zizania palustris]